MSRTNKGKVFSVIHFRHDANSWCQFLRYGKDGMKKHNKKRLHTILRRQDKESTKEAEL